MSEKKARRCAPGDSVSELNAIAGNIALDECVHSVRHISSTQKNIRWCRVTQQRVNSSRDCLRLPCTLESPRTLTFLQGDRQVIVVDSQNNARAMTQEVHSRAPLQSLKNELFT